MIMASVCWSILPRGWTRSPGERAVARGPNVSLGLMRLCARMPTVLAAGGAGFLPCVDARMPTELTVGGAGLVSCVDARMPTGLTVRGAAAQVVLVSGLVGLVVCRCLKRLPVGGCGCGFDVLWVFA